MSFTHLKEKRQDDNSILILPRLTHIPVLCISMSQVHLKVILRPIQLMFRPITVVQGPVKVNELKHVALGQGTPVEHWSRFKVEQVLD